jgi:flagellar basal-body rod protein FlgG
MISQQQNVDTIANNLANVNTTGYKKERMEFKTLLYDMLRQADLDPANQTGRPVNLQIGLGVRPIAVAKIFTQGNLQRTDHYLDLAIEGDAFFVIQRGEELTYSKDGTFKISVGDGSTIVTAEGYPLVSVDGESIVVPAEVPVQDVSISEEGILTYIDAEGVTQDLGYQIALVQFSNPQGLESIGANLLRQTTASGEPIYEADGDVAHPSRVLQGVMEMANVQVAEEMVNLIVAQRAYDLNSKAITTSDEMLQTANNLKR